MIKADRICRINSIYLTYIDRSLQISTEHAVPVPDDGDA